MLLRDLMKILLLLIGLFGGCAGSEVQREPIPYSYRQGMLAATNDNQKSSVATAATAEPLPMQSIISQERKSNPLGDSEAASRCVSLVGKTFDGPQEQAEQDMIKACLRLSESVDFSQNSWRQKVHGQPLLGDVAIFYLANATMAGNKYIYGIVVGRNGPKVQFIYLRQSRVKLGALNLRAPQKRRQANGQIENTYLRVKKIDDQPSARYLAGEMLIGFVSAPESSSLSAAQ